MLSSRTISFILKVATPNSVSLTVTCQDPRTKISKQFFEKSAATTKLVSRDRWEKATQMDLRLCLNGQVAIYCFTYCRVSPVAVFRNKSYRTVDAGYMKPSLLAAGNPPGPAKTKPLYSSPGASIVGCCVAEHQPPARVFVR